MSQPKLEVLVTNDSAYMENGYTVFLREGGPCWIIDPGFPPQAERILRHIRTKSLQPQAVVLTHAHPDHIAGIDEVRDALGDLPVYLAREEWGSLTDPVQNLSALIGPGLTTKVVKPRDLPHGGKLSLDGTEWAVSDTSGHSPGGRSLYCASLGIAFVGDALFAGSVGRVDFPNSDGRRLIQNIRENLMTLPDATRVLSGHGPETTIGREKKSNPFILHGM